MTLNRLGQLTPQAVRYLVSRYSDWSQDTMVRLAWCESRWKPAAWNPKPVWASWLGGWVHSQGLLGVLDGSMAASISVDQAHSLWLRQGYSAWRGDFDDGCA